MTNHDFKNIKPLSRNEFLSLKLTGNRYKLKKILKVEDHPKTPFAQSLAVLTQDFKLWNVRDLAAYWANSKRDYPDFDHIVATPFNWMYLYCVKHGFRDGLPEAYVNIYGKDSLRLSPEAAEERMLQYPKLSGEPLANWLEENPITIKGNKVKNGFHRIAAMIHHEINDGYIPIHAIST